MQGKRCRSKAVFHTIDTCKPKQFVSIWYVSKPKSVCIRARTKDDKNTEASCADLIFWGLQPLGCKAPEGVLAGVPQGAAQPLILGKVGHQPQLYLAVVC